MSLETLFQFLMLIGYRYFIIAGSFFLIFYILFSRKFNSRRIQHKKQQNADYWREIYYSCLTIAIFSIIPVFFLTNSFTKPYTTVYSKIDAHGWMYFIAIFPLLFVLHDTYFYWAHRLMHHKKLFNLFHLTHHKSTNPSPWTAYAFHPLEAIIESGIFVIFIFAFPVHQIHLIVFFLLMFIYNVYGHLGYELYPKNFQQTWIGKWINTSVAHNMHHQYFKGNYGLYFLFWDRIMGTVSPNYNAQFNKVTNQKAQLNTKKHER
jgi:lathosterol oxidase